VYTQLKIINTLLYFQCDGRKSNIKALPGPQITGEASIFRAHNKKQKLSKKVCCKEVNFSL
jgi:hypothetical protein